MDESERELLKRALNVLHNARVEIEVVRELSLIHISEPTRRS